MRVFGATPPPMISEKELTRTWVANRASQREAPGETPLSAQSSTSRSCVALAGATEKPTFWDKQPRKQQIDAEKIIFIRHGLSISAGELNSNAGWQCCCCCCFWPASYFTILAEQSRTEFCNKICKLICSICAMIIINHNKRTHGRLLASQREQT